MRTYTKLAAAIICAAEMVFSAHALTITPTSGPKIFGDETSQRQIDAAIASAIGSSITLYKRDVSDGSATGPFANSYNTSFFNGPSDPKDATISYVGGSAPAINSNPVYLLVKDGDSDPAWYVFTLNGWNGTEAIVINDFWPKQGAISHVALYGIQGSNQVPDAGGTLVLLGLVLGAMGLIRRRSGA